MDDAVRRLLGLKAKDEDMFDSFRSEDSNRIPATSSFEPSRSGACPT